MDLALAKNTKISERMNMQIRVDAFDVLNHPNYGQPGGSGVFWLPLFSHPLRATRATSSQPSQLSVARAFQPAILDQLASCSLL